VIDGAGALALTLEKYKKQAAEMPRRSPPYIIELERNIFIRPNTKGSFMALNRSPLFLQSFMMLRKPP
jgi:hypothetical protein